MERKSFLKLLIGGASMVTFNAFKSFTETLKEDGTVMPLLFVGHGSPMNGIEDNDFSRRWSQMGKEIPAPAAVLCISAHWYTQGVHITVMDRPKTIHDFSGFPQELFEVQYPAPGNPPLAKDTAGMVKKTSVGLDHEWGLDHGCWVVVKRMYPEAKIPVLQLSIDYTKPPQWHFDLGKELAALRKKGVLIIGSGNMVHNLRMMDWELPETAYDWALKANDTFKQLIMNNEYKKLIAYETLGSEAKLSIPTPDHYLPLMYVLSLKGKDESISIFNDKTVMGSVSMTSVKISKA